MTMTLRCEDLGFTCKFTLLADNEEELLAQALEHAQNVHSTRGASKDLRARILDAIGEI